MYIFHGRWIRVYVDSAIALQYHAPDSDKKKKKSILMIDSDCSWLQAEFLLHEEIQISSRYYALPYFSDQPRHAPRHLGTRGVCVGLCSEATANHDDCPAESYA